MENKRQLAQKYLRKHLICKLEIFIARSKGRAKLFRELWKDHLKKCPDDFLFSDQLHHHMKIHELDIKMYKETLKDLNRKKNNK